MLSTTSIHVLLYTCSAQANSGTCSNIHPTDQAGICTAGTSPCVDNYIPEEAGLCQCDNASVEAYKATTAINSTQANCELVNIPVTLVTSCVVNLCPAPITLNRGVTSGTTVGRPNSVTLTSCGTPPQETIGGDIAYQYTHVGPSTTLCYMLVSSNADLVLFVYNSDMCF